MRAAGDPGQHPQRGPDIQRGREGGLPPPATTTTAVIDDTDAAADAPAGGFDMDKR